MLYIGVAIAAFGGGFIQSVTGFGAGIVIMSVLPYLFDMAEAPGVSSAICVFLSSFLAWKYRKHLDWRLILLPGIVYIAASTCAIHSIHLLDLHILKLLFGIFLAVMSCYYLFFSRYFSVKNTAGALIACSAFSGITAGLFGIGGPLMALCILSRTENRERYIANLQTLFVFTGLFCVAVRIADGLFSAKMLPIVLLGAAFMQVGQMAGSTAAAKLNANQFKNMVYAFIGLYGLQTVSEFILSR